jgi:hypothetical protein
LVNINAAESQNGASGLVYTRTQSASRLSKTKDSQVMFRDDRPHGGIGNPVQAGPDREFQKKSKKAVSHREGLRCIEACPTRRFAKVATAGLPTANPNPAVNS